MVKEALDNERRSALHVAAMGGHEKVVRCLINEGGLNRNAKDQDGCVTDTHHTPSRSLSPTSNTQHPHTSHIQTYTQHPYAFNPPPFLAPLLLTLPPLCPPAHSCSCTALHLAVSHGDVKLVKWLVGEGRLEPEAIDNEGRTPFLLAVEKNRESVVRWLLEKVGVNRHATLPEGKENALHRAAFFGHGRLLRYLVEDAKLPLHALDAWGHTPLHLAAYRGHGAIVRYVCEVWPVGRDGPDKDGKTPLHLAAYRGHDAIVRSATQLQEETRQRRGG